MYSTGHALEKAYICLRCQSRHARLRVSRLEGRHQARSTRYFTSGNIYQQDHAIVDNGKNVDETINLPVKLSPSHSKDGVPQFNPISTYPQFRRLLVRGKVAKLGVDVLGRPAEIRILRDDQMYLQRSHGLLLGDVSETGRANEKDGLSASELLQKIDSQRGLVNSNVVNDNIEQLRKLLRSYTSSTTLVTSANHQEVAKNLYDGFTASQLSGYLERAQPTSPLEEPEVAKGMCTKMYTRSAWFPGESSFPSEALRRLHSLQFLKLPDVAVAKGGTKGKGKKNLVERILRKCWKVRIREEEERLGELDIVVQEDAFRLLIDHEVGVIKTLSDRYGSKIDISKSEHLIRITADFSTCSEVLKGIQYIVENVLFEEITLPPPKYHVRKEDDTTSLIVNKSLIEHIGKITSTIIKPMFKGSNNDNLPQNIMVYYLGPNQSNLEDARRLILQSMTPVSSRESQVIYCASLAIQPIQKPVETGLALPWAQRTSPLARWTIPLKTKNKEFSPGATPYNVMAKNDLAIGSKSMNIVKKFLNSPWKQFASAEKSSSTSRSWESTIDHCAFASIGQVLYTANNSTIQIVNKQETQKHKLAKGFQQSMLSSSRVLHTAVPETLSMLGSMTLQVKSVEQELCIRLSPLQTFDSDRQAVNSFPDILISITIDEESKTTSLRMVRLMIEEKNLDLLLPGCAVDVRFHSQSSLYGGVIPDRHIMQFIKDSNLDVWGQNRLQTPARLKLQLPTCILPLFRIKDQVTLDASPQNEISVEYSFTSLDHRSHIGMRYQGSDLVYSTIEAGRMGGRRDELLIFAEAHGSKPLVSHNGDTSSASGYFPQFLQSVRNIVDEMSA